MRTQSEIDDLVLQYLYDATNEGRNHSTEDNIVAHFLERSISRIRVIHSLNSLTEQKLVDCYSGNSIKIVTSKYGNDVRVDCAYDINLSGIREFENRSKEKAQAGLEQLSSRRQPVLQDSSSTSNGYLKPEINWTKLGALSAALAIPIMIALWWLT
jgi:hypothetical protein